MNMLDTLSSWFLAATVRGSLCALAVLLLQAAFRPWLPARWRYAMWLPVILVLAAPLLPQSRWSLENYFARKPVAAPPAMVNVRSEFTGELPSGPGIAATVSKPPLVDWRRLLQAAWLCGSAGTLAVALAAYGRTLRRMRQGAVQADEGLVSLIAETATACGLRPPPRLLASTGVQSPAVTGFPRALLLLPANFSSSFTPTEARLILRHELTHLRRHDLSGNWLLCLLQAVHWCNPLLWFVFSRIRADREAACDAQVLAAEEDCRADYGHALLKLQGVLASSILNLGFVGIFENAAGMRSRVRAIASYRRAHPAWGFASVTMIAVLTLIGVTRAQVPGVPTGVSKSEENKHKLETIIIPKLEFRDVTVREAIAYLRKVSLELDPSKTGVNIAPRGIAAVPSACAGRNAPIIVSPLETHVTLSLSNIPLGEALRYVSSLAGLKCMTDETGVFVVPENFYETQFVTREWAVTREKMAAIGYEAGDKLDEFLLASGISMPRGASTTLSPDGLRLTVKNTPENLEVVEAMFRPVPAKSPEEELIGKIRAKLNNIILPKLEFREATIREAIDFLKKKSVEWDPEKAHPENAGVNTVLQLEAAIPPGPAASNGPAVIPGLPPNAANTARITVSLNNIPLGEALKYVTALAGLKYKIEPYGIRIVPLSVPTNTLVTKQWAVTPAMLSGLGYKAGSDMKDLLTAQGMTFPPGAAVLLIRNQTALIMKNTEDRQDLLGALLEAKAATPAPRPSH